MNPDDLTIEDLERALEAPAELWHGKCTTVARAAKRLIGESAHEIYGHYRGPVDENGYWGKRAMFRHGWVLLSDGRVLDPTRWSFENKDPYVYIGPNDDEYDEGGQTLRRALFRPCPPSTGAPSQLDLQPGEQEIVGQLTGVSCSDITVPQLHWMANIPYDELDWALTPVYAVLIRHGLRTFIPIDNLKRAIREGRIPDLREKEASL